MTVLRWQTELSSAEKDSVRALVEAAAGADGVAPVGDQVLRELSGSTAEHLVGCDGDRIVGYLALIPGRDGVDATAELVVHPDARRRGLGTRLLQAAIARTGGRVRIWAHGTLPAARAVAGRLNLTPARELVRMSRPLAGGAAGTLVPQGIRIRSYEGSGDHPELLRVNNAAFSWHPEQGGWTDADIAARLAEDWFDPAGLFLAFDDATGALLGFHWTKVHDHRVGEVYVLGVDPAAQGRGLGRAITQVGIDHLAGRLAGGADPEVILYVESDNAAALGTYRGLGFTVAAVDTAYTPA